MKIIVTRVTPSMDIYYFKFDKVIDRDESMTYHVEFVKDLEQAIDNNGIYDIVFLSKRVLKIEYIVITRNGFKELRSVNIFFAENISLDDPFFTAINHLIKTFEKKKVFIRESIERLLEESRQLVNNIEDCRSILKRYVLAGLVIDDKTNKDAARIFSVMITKKFEILEKLELPLPFKSKMKLNFLKATKKWQIHRYGTFAYNDEIDTIQRGWLEYVWKSFIKDYNDRHNFFLEGASEPIKLPERNVEPFIKFILADIEYIRTLGAEKYHQELIDLENLSKRYIDQKRKEVIEGIPIDIVSFLNELTDIEMATFSKNPNKGLIRNGSEIVKKEFIEERLRYLGIDTIETVDPFLNFIFEQVRRITTYPYQGCETELVELYKIAGDYVRERSDNQATLVIRTPGSELLKKETALELVITRKIKECKQYEELASDLELLEDAIAKVREGECNNNSEKDDKSLANIPLS